MISINQGEVKLSDVWQLCLACFCFEKTLFVLFKNIWLFNSKNHSFPFNNKIRCVNYFMLRFLPSFIKFLLMQCLLLVILKNMKIFPDIAPLDLYFSLWQNINKGISVTLIKHSFIKMLKWNLWNKSLWCCSMLLMKTTFKNMKTSIRNHKH